MSVIRTSKSNGYTVAIKYVKEMEKWVLHCEGKFALVGLDMDKVEGN